MALQLKANTRVVMLVTLQALLLPTTATERQEKRKKLLNITKSSNI
jgi:hypothetical protein